MDRIACVLGFDLLGGRRRRIDDCFSLSDRSLSPFHLTFTRLLHESPGAFTWSVGLDAPPAVRVEWRSTLADCGVIHVFIADEPASLSLFLPGRNRRSETAAIEGVAAALASRPANTFRPAFDAFLAARDRPLIAALRFLPAGDASALAIISAIERSIAVPFFAASVSNESTGPASQIA